MSKALCKRCGQPFEPTLLEALNRMSTCCVICSIRNLHDGLSLPTPPELLDPYSKDPALTEEEYQRKLKKA